MTPPAWAKGQTELVTARWYHTSRLLRKSSDGQAREQRNSLARERCQKPAGPSGPPLFEIQTDQIEMRCRSANFQVTRQRHTHSALPRMYKRRLPVYRRRRRRQQYRKGRPSLNLCVPSQQVAEVCSDTGWRMVDEPWSKCGQRHAADLGGARRGGQGWSHQHPTPWPQ